MNKRINFEKITIQNFLSVGEPVEFDFQTHPGLNYVYGVNPELGIRNGIGKSAIFVDAVLFALFGETARKITNAHIPNRNSRKKCMVRLQFSIDGKTYVVEHMLNPSQYTLLEVDPATGATVQDLTKSSKNLTMDYVKDELLNTSADLCRFSFVMSTSGEANLFNMKEAQRRDFVDYVFSYTTIGEAFEKVKTDLNDADKRLAGEKSVFLRLEADAEEFSRKDEEFKKAKEEKMNKLSLEMQQLEEKAKAPQILPEMPVLPAAVFPPEIVKKEVPLPKYLDVCQIPDHTEKISRIEKTLLEINRNMEDTREKISKLHSKKAVMEQLKETGHQTAGKYSDILNIVCGDCREKLNDVLKIDDALNKAKAAEEMIEKIDLAIKSAEHRLSEFRTEDVEASETVRLMVEETEQKRKAAEKAEKENLRMEREYSARVAQNEKTYSEQCLERVQKISEMEKIRVEKYNNAVIEREKKIAEIEKNTETLFMAAKAKRDALAQVCAETSEWEKFAEERKTAANKSKENINSLVEEKKYLEFLKFMFSKEGIKKELISSVISQFNRRISEYLEEMKCEYAVVFDQEFVPTFVTTQGVCGYDSFSAGEKRRLDMAAVFALRDLIFSQGKPKTNLLVVDECLDSALDSVGLNAIMDILRREAETQSIFVISHRDHGDLDIGFDNVIRLEKRGGQTIIAEDSAVQHKKGQL